MHIVPTTQSLDQDCTTSEQDLGRRAADRIQTVFRIGRVISDHDEGLVRIRNISDEGARLRLALPVVPGDTLTIELAEDATMTGRVVWAEGNDCGLQFDTAIDCSDMLARLADCTVKGISRPVRLPVTRSVITRSECGIRLAAVEDVSQRGMKLRHDGTFTKGLTIQITLPSGLERSGVVRWSHDGVAGIMLLEPFSAEDLGSARNL